MEHITQIVADFFGMKYDRVFEKSRKREVIIVRQIAIYLIKKNTYKSLHAIGNFFNKNHSTVVFSVTAVENDMATNIEFKEYINRIQNIIDDNELNFHNRKSKFTPFYILPQLSA